MISYEILQKPVRPLQQQQGSSFVPGTPMWYQNQRGHHASFQQRLEQQRLAKLAERTGTSIDVTKEVVEQEALREQNQQRMAEGEKPVPWVPVGASEHRGGPISAIAMGKHGYNMFLNTSVYGKYHKGQLVTTNDLPFVVGHAPRTWYKITEIQEIYYMADMDNEKKEPKAICVESGKYKISCWMAPGRLRALQPEELEAVNDFLRNPPKQIDQADRPDSGDGEPSPS